ncbi:hypothetical protein [Bradyrhizobium roseum]|uniref:hypothetical protein n=1 Tax=Bradyrhizobium roseum TaxID=3056648 RepID=UPI002639C569|nr:hypothetical protein [Bradyrhizobium roseus]WKA26451.1 hypothetical protein QUH67_22970 [Bradyrhizobium roseus]
MELTSSTNASVNQTSKNPSSAATAAQSAFGNALNEAVSTAGDGSPPRDLPAGQLGFSQLVEDIDKTKEWISRQTTSSPEMDRNTERLQELQSELTKRQDGMRKAGSAPKGKATSKGPAREQASSDAMPRMLRERTSIQYGSPNEARAELDRIAAWLQRSDVSPSDRRLLQTELDNLAPQFEQGRQQQAEERRTQVITQALAPSSGLSDAKAQVLDSLRRIDGIVALPDRPGYFALMRGSEQIVLTSQEVAQLRTNAGKSLDTAAKQARGLNETTFGRLNDHMKLNYEEQPYVGFAVSVVCGEEPVELYDRVQPMVATSNSTLTRYRQQSEAGAPLASRAAILLEGVEGAEHARVTLDKGVDRAVGAAGDIVTGLKVTRDLSFAVSLSIGAVVAAPVVAAGVGAGGLGLTGAGAVAATGVGTGTVVGAGGFALRGSSAAVGELAAGHSREQALSVGWQEGKRGAKEGFVSGVGGGVGLSTGRALGLGAQQLSRAQTVARSMAAGSGGGGSSELARGIIEQRGVVDILKRTGEGLVLGGAGGSIGGASSTISNPVLRQTAAIGGDVGLNAGVAYAETGSLREAALAGANSIAVSGGVAAARQHPTGTSTGERWAADVGKSAKREAVNLAASAMLGMADVPALRGTGAAPGAVIGQPLSGGRMITEAPTRPVTSTNEGPVKAAEVAQAGSNAAADRGQTATQTTQPTTHAEQTAASQATQPSSTARIAGPEVFAEISAELGLGTPAQSTLPGVRGAVADAAAAGLIGHQGAPGTVDVAFQAHGSASDVRGQYGVTGAQRQSAHINATAFVRTAPGYSRSAAPTLLLNASTHRAFDNHWKQWAMAQRRAGRTDCSISEMRSAMHAAIDNIPNLSPKVRGTMAWRLDLEIHELGLADGDRVPLPYSNVRPTQ